MVNLSVPGGVAVFDLLAFFCRTAVCVCVGLVGIVVAGGAVAIDTTMHRAWASTRPYQLRGRSLASPKCAKISGKALGRSCVGDSSAPLSHLNVVTAFSIGIGLAGGRRKLRAGCLVAGGLNGRHRRTVANTAIPHNVAPVVITEDVRRPVSDEKSYRVLELANGLQVLLASDPTADAAAAALAVKCGTFQDPDDRPGLAHFHEHMLFLGTEKYPREDEYIKFLNEHGGDSNAFTMGEFTTYYFKVASPHLPGALDRFSQFFVAPTFDPSCVEREMNAVDSESTNYSTEDGWRMLQIQKTTVSSAHPYHRFDVGNLATLGADNLSKTRETLINWNREHYQAGVMKLVVVGRDSLEELQSLVTTHFSPVRSGSGVEQKYMSLPWPLEKLGRMVYTVPLKETRSLSVNWPMPPRSTHPFLKPELYVAHALGHEGMGSLHDALNQRGWVDKLTAGPSSSFSDSQLFSLNVTLTPEGDENRDEVLALLFAYINLIRSTGPLEATFRELASVQEIAFAHKEESPAPDDFAANVAHSLFQYPPREAIRGPFAVDDWHPAVVTQYLELLKPERCIIFVSSPTLAAAAGMRSPDDQVGEGWQREQWYNAPFREEPISAMQMERWQGAVADAESGLNMPEPNPFIPQDFSLRGSATPVASRVPAEVDAPVAISSNSLVRLWHKTDHAFCSPRAYVLAHANTLAYDAGPETVMMMRLFCNVVNDDLNTYAYDASIAGLGFSLEYSDNLSLSVGGFSDKLPGLLKVLLDRFYDVLLQAEANQQSVDKIDGRAHELLERLDVQREILLADYKNLTREDPWSVSSYYASQIMIHECWHLDEYVEVLERPASLGGLAAAVRPALARMQVEAFVHGNASIDEARSFNGMLQEFLANLESAPLAVAPRRAVTMLPHDVETIFEYDLAEKNPAQENCSTQNIYQVGVAEEDWHRVACLMLVCQIAGTSAYEKLRTQEQLGYIVNASVWSEQYVCGLSVLVQGARLTPSEVDHRIEEWLQCLEAELKAMTEEEFATNVSAVVNEHTQRYAMMAQETMRHWFEIVSRRYCFDRIARSVENLQSLRKSDVLEFFRQYLAPTAAKRRKLSLRILGFSANGPRSKDDTGVKLLRDLSEIREFKSSCEVFPVPEPTKLPDNS